MEIRFRLPSVPPGLGSNLLGVAGLVAVVVAVGMLAGLAWAVLGGGLIAVGLALLAQTTAQQSTARRDVGTDQPLRRVA